MGHSPVQGGMSTDMRGVVIDAFRVTFGASGAPTLVDNGKTGLILSVVKTATGRYTFTLNPNYYAKLVAVLPALSCVSAAGAVNTARYVEATYNATTGVFEIDVTDDEATPAAVDPTNGVAMDVLVVFQRYSNLG